MQCAHNKKKTLFDRVEFEPRILLTGRQQSTATHLLSISKYMLSSYLYKQTHEYILQTVSLVKSSAPVQTHLDQAVKTLS